MTLTLDLPRDLEERLTAGAASQGLPLEQYALRLLGSAAGSSASPVTGAELVDYWRREGVLGSRPEITDSQGHARRLRSAAQMRHAE